MYELENIGFAYGPKTIIADLSLTFEKGHFYGIMGPNGSGKTTLIDLLAGHLRPNRDTIRLNGRSLPHCSRKLLARWIALMPMVVAVMQDVNLAAMYCDHLVCLRNGSVFAGGPVDTVLTTEVLKAVFQVNTRVTPNEFSGTRQVVFNRDVN